jgi:hypothetical protein
MTGHGSALEKESKVESVHLEEAQQGDAPVYGIDEAHQKRVLYVATIFANSRPQVNY